MLRIREPVHLVVWSTRMAIVQRGGIVPAGTYTRVGAVAAPPLEVAKVLEQALQLVLGHARPHPPHHLRQRRGLRK